MQLTAAAVTPPAEHAARRPAGADAAAADACVMSTWCERGVDPMKKTVLLVGVLVLASNPLMSGERIEASLPALVGLYSQDGIGERSDIFHLSKFPVHIDSVFIRLRGTHYVGAYYHISSIAGAPWGMKLSAVIPDSMSGGYWQASDYAPIDVSSCCPPPSVEFVMEIPFQSQSGATWEFLSCCEGEVDLGGSPWALNTWVCSGAPKPTVQIDEAVLVILGDFLVGTESSTWGGIKSLFR